MELIETSVFTRQVENILSPDEFRELPRTSGAISPPLSFECCANSWAKIRRRRAMRKELFDELVASVREMKDIQAGRKKPSRVTRAADVRVPDIPDVAALRARFRLSQVKFAALLGISVNTLQNWEQHRREPEGPAKVLLRVAATHPEALLSVSKPSPRPRSRRSAA